MINLFLKAKHWQLFLLTFAVPMILNIFVIVSMVITMVGNNDPSPEFMLNYFAFWPVMIIISVGTLMGWQWSIVIGLQPKMPAGATVNLTRFKIFFFFPLVYMLLITVAVSIALLSFSVNVNFPVPNPLLIGIGVTALILTHLFSMFCMFHSIYCVAQTVKATEWGHAVTFNDFIGEFFLIWFFVIGVWILQPKINKIVKGEFTGGGLPQYR